MDIVVTGASGFLGSRFQHLLGKEHNIAGTYYEASQRNLVQLDITRLQSVIDLVQDLDPDVIIHTAAIADPDTCARNPESAVKINEEGTAHVAEAAKRVGAKMVYISTSFVFPANGAYSPDDSPSPQTVYGQTKYNAEQTVKNTLDDHLILRCPKLFGTSDGDETNDIVGHILQSLAEDDMVELDDTTERYPLLVDDVISATQRLLDINAQGVYHISTHKAYTKYEFGKRVADIFDISGELVPVEGDPFVDRPSGIELETTEIKRLGVAIQSVEQGLDTVKHQRGCSFKTIYSFKPDKLIKGESANKIRAQLGKELGQDDDLDADIVVPVPESGIYPATGYADETGIPLYHGIIRDYETDKTLYEPNVEDRTRMLRKKLVAVDDILKGNRVVIVDEAIISGLTLSAVINKCQTAGASEIHVRIPSPPMRTQCEFGVLSDDADLLVSSDSESVNEIQTQLQNDFSLTSIQYLPLDRFEQAVPSDYGFTCTECFKGEGESR